MNQRTFLRTALNGVIVLTLALTLSGCLHNTPTPSSEENYFQIITLQDMVLLTNFGASIVTNEGPMHVTASLGSPAPGSTGSVSVLSKWSDWKGRLNVINAVLPGTWRVQANSGLCRGQYIMDFIDVKRGDIVHAWCRATQQVTSGLDTFNDEGDVVQKSCCYTDTLYAGDYLNVSDYITSGDSRFNLVHHGNGELILFDERGAGIWGSNTPDWHTSYAYMQHDGNFVLYNSSGGAIWDTGTWGNPGAFLKMQNDGNLVVYRSDGYQLWASNTCCR